MIFKLVWGLVRFGLGLVGSKFQKYWAYDTKYSQAVTHPSTNLAQCCLTSVIRRELVLSTWYGRRHLLRGNALLTSGLLNNILMQQKGLKFYWFKFSDFCFSLCVYFFVWCLCSRGKMIHGDAGYRSPYLSHAKRALYHLSYIPLGFTLCSQWLEISLGQERKNDKFEIWIKC